MEPFAAIVSGGGAGLLGAALAHALTVLAERLGAAGWVRAPYGMQIFALSLNTAILYAAIGAASGPRPAAPALGFAASFFGLLLPLVFLSRFMTLDGVRWALAVSALYSLVLWGTVAALGAAGARTRAWRGALSAVLGTACAAALLKLVLLALPGYENAAWNPRGWVASPVNFLDGLLSGAGLCLALSLDQRLARRTP